ncbi:sensor domain-containing diguanylate cyclase [Hydrogenophaga atypica]|uniref:diguanylate cyclase n=1 Tax=Hydrogenophaga atypica TaxID=249409 RepID=A0ABW2QR65_9BURK
MSSKPGIRARLWLAAALPTVLVVVALLWVFLSRYAEDLTEAWQERARVAATQLAGAAEFPLFANDIETLQRLVEASHKGDSQLRAVKVFDRDGRLLVSAGTLQGGLLPLEARVQLEISGERLTVLVPIEGSPAARVDLFQETTGLGLPQPDATTPRGFVLMQFGLESLERRRSELLAWALAATLGAMLLATLLSTAIASRVTRPIGQISLVVQRIASGSLDARTNPQHCGALSGLAQGVNEMAQQVAMTQQELRQQVELATRELREQKEAAERAARLDALTQVLGRRGFTEQAHTEIQRSMRYQHPLSLLMIDIDHFKTINDTHGHATGDAVLLHFAQLLARELRENDMIGRIGGEEFAVLLPNSNAEQAARVAERMREAVANSQIHVRGQPLHFTASFGVAEFQAQELSLESLMARADAALYEAKRQGRNRVLLANPPGV